jgi:hypothetical protein
MHLSIAYIGKKGIYVSVFSIFIKNMIQYIEFFGLLTEYSVFQVISHSCIDNML